MKTLSLRKNIIKPSYTATYLPIFLQNDENTIEKCSLFGEKSSSKAPSLASNLPLNLRQAPSLEKFEVEKSGYNVRLFHNMVKTCVIINTWKLLSNRRCPCCGLKSPSVQQYTYDIAPKYLVLALNRFIAGEGIAERKLVHEMNIEQ